ncbi:general substrate transporter [Calocera viscosa TUFC12733]|uniref:General substrate transporter n=1 Tax=Calocera viscosa (strain TUFC12733) TaxID=1330018 RepID=A0A167FSE1_CALVF|nr:general substrate transporter [Calocera viscosa TUFC12733]
MSTWKNGKEGYGPDKPSEVESYHLESLGHDGQLESAQQAFVELASINLRLALINIWSMVSALGFGFAAAIIASSLGQPNLATYFDFANRSNVSGIEGAIAGLFNVGGFFGVLSTPVVSDRWGRKSSFWFAGFFVLLGAGLGAGSINVTMLILARFFTGYGAWSFVVCTIVYQQELAPATRRGILGGSVGVAVVIGYCLAAWVGVGFFFLDAKDNWRAPLVLQAACPIFTLCTIYLVPESPRWLAGKGRTEEALAVLKYVHYSKEDPEFAVARAEHFQIVQQVALDKTLPSSWISMFTKYRKRSFAAVLVTGANMLCGTQVIANYGPLLYAALGFSSEQSLLIAAGWITLSVALSIIAASVVDRVGRVPLLVGGSVGCALIWSIYTALIAQFGDLSNTNLAAKRAAIAMLFVFLIGYELAACTQYLYIGEIFPTHIRVKGVALGLMMLNLMTIWITESAPTAADTIGWKYYLVFIFCCVVCGMAQYILIPETKGFPLEEIAEIFGDAKDVAIHAKDIAVNPHTAEVVHRV